jgi:hypothetical protein
LTGSFEHNRDRVQEWARSINDTVRPMISGLIASFTGFHLDSLRPDQFVKADEWRTVFERIEGYVSSFVIRVKNFFLDTIPVSVGVITKALEGIAFVFEKLTGIHLSPEQMGLTLLVGQITGINNVIFHLGELIVGLALIFASASIPVAAFGVTANISLGSVVLTLGLIVAAALLAKNALEQINKKEFWDDMNTSTERTTEIIKSSLGSMKMMWEWIKGNITFDELKKFNEETDKRIDRDFPSPEMKHKREAETSGTTPSAEQQGGIFDQIKNLLTGPSEEAKRNLDEAKRAVSDGAAQGAGALTGSATSLKDAAGALSGAAGSLGKVGQGASNGSGGGGTSGGLSRGTSDQSTPTYNGPPGGANGGPVADLLRFAGGGPVSDGGGPVRGPGTGTSDSIPAVIDGKRPARIANGEFIVRADGSNLMDAFHFFSRSFNFGGISDMLSASAPRFATGGPVGDVGPAMRGYYAVDLRTDKGTYRVRADEATARSLNKDASFQRMVSTGNKPGWFT